MKIDAVILTKSNMWGKFCVAGIDVNCGKWIRFVLDEYGEPLSDANLKFTNTSGICKPLDIVRFEAVRYAPIRNHTENYIVEPFSCTKLGSCGIDDVLKIHPAEMHKYIFCTNDSNIGGRFMDRLRLNYSLMLIYADTVEIRSNDGKSRAAFMYNGTQYEYMRITDPDYAGRNELITEAYIVMSMPNTPFRANGKYYKFVAKIYQV